MDEPVSGNRVLSSVRMEQDVLVVSLRGDINLNNSPDVRAALLDLLHKRSAKRAVLNLAQVPYMDSSAVAVLIEIVRKLGRGGKVMLTDLQPRVKGLLEIARLDSIFSLVPTEQEALARK